MATVDLSRIKRRCRQTPDEIMRELGGIRQTTITQMDYAFKDNGSKVLAVAHLDTALKTSTFRIVRLDTETLCYSPMLDDRLGVYTIMDLLPKLGIVVDVLLTEGEESAQSTAFHFTHPEHKKYNWVVEFDRRGDDAVTYQYDWEKTIKKYFKVSTGSFSDISELEHLGCQAVNIGVGYYHEHTHRCFFSDAEYVSQINKFVEMWGKEANTYHAFQQKKGYSRYVWNNGWGALLGEGSYYEKWLADRNNRGRQSQWWELDDDVEDVEEGEYVAKEDERIIHCPLCLEQFYEGQTIQSCQGYLCPECGELIDYRLVQGGEG